MPHSFRDQEDMDAVLSNIMRGGNSSPAAQPSPQPMVSTASGLHPKPQPSAQFKPHPVQSFPNTQPTQPSQATPAPEMPRRKKTGFKKRYVVLPAILILLGMGGFFLRQPIATLMAQPSPFSSELIQNIGFPLYYPTKLPNGFKIELNSIQSGNGVVVYVISDDSNRTISLSLQAQPEGLTLDAAIQSLKATTNSRKLVTPIGEASVGVSNSEKRLMANVLTGKTWILINAAEGSINDTEIDQILNSFKQASL